MRYQDVNALAIGRWIEEGWEWGRPIDHETFARAKVGDWTVQLTPTKPVPAEWFGNLTGKRVLALASGGGQQGPIFTAAGAQVTVLDYTPGQLEAERMVATREGYDIALVRADMTNPLPFENDAFDLVFNPVSICYIRELENLWHEVARVLAPGGVFLTGFDTIINFLVDEAEERIVWPHPFDPTMQPEAREFLEKEDCGMQFGHDLTQTLGGILRAGFMVTDMYEDTNGEGRLHELGIPTYLALRAVLDKRNGQKELAPMAKESLFRIRNYPAWFGADTFLLAGSAVHWIVISVLAYELSGSVTVAGWFATARGVVSAITQITGGTFIDRHDHRTLMLVQAGACSLLWFAMGLLFVTGHLTFAWFAGLCLTSSAIFGFLNGTTNAALIRVVGPKRYAEAESLNQGRDAAVNTAGSPLGAGLFGISQAFPFFASAFFDAAAFVCAYFLDLPKDDVEPSGKRGALSFLTDMVDGWRWVFASKTIVSAVAIIGLVQFGLFAVHQAVNLSLVASGTDPLLISLANVGAALGTMVGSAISTRVCNHVPVGRGVALILVSVSLAYIPMILFKGYGFVVLSTCLASLPMPLFSALVNGFVFSKTPVSKQGRTRASVMTVIMLFGSLSGAVAGELLPRIGFGGFVACLAVLSLLSAAIVLVNPRIRNLPASPEWESVQL